MQINFNESSIISVQQKNSRQGSPSGLPFFHVLSIPHAPV